MTGPMATRYAILIAWIGLFPSLHAASPLQIDAVTVKGRQLPWHSGQELKTGAFPEEIKFRFGPVSNSGWAPIRLRCKLEGYEGSWHEGPGSMTLTVRFLNAAGERVAQSTFQVSGNSTGWNGSLETSTLTHRRITLTVPRGANQAQVVISSAGPPETVGVYVVDDLVMSRASPRQGAPTILLRSPFDRTSASAPTDKGPPDWIRDGIRPKMAQVVELGQTPKTKAFAILDDDPLGHAEWRNRGDLSARIFPGEKLVVEWNEMFSIGTGNINHADYEKLPAGRYDFRVQEETILGTPTGVEASLPFVVPSPLWQSSWFLAAMSVLAIAISSLGVRYISWTRMRRSMARLEQQQALQREKLRIAQDIHDDLGVRVTQISLVSAVAQADPAFPAKARAEFDRISRMSRELVSALYETVWAVNPENDNLDAVGTFLCQKINELCTQAQLRCRLHVVDLPQNIQISSQARHNISMAVKEAVHNVVKHANASLLTVRVAFDDMLLTVCIEDDGRGFQASDAAAGHGLVNMKRRLQDIGGKCLVESTPGSGTIVRLEFGVKSLNKDRSEGAPPRPSSSAPEPPAVEHQPFYEENSHGS